MLECYRGDPHFIEPFYHRIARNQTRLTGVAGHWICAIRPRGITRGGQHIPILSCGAKKILRLSCPEHQEWYDLWVDAFENPRGFAGHRSV